MAAKWTSQKYSIWRTYYKNRRNILASAQIIHRYLFYKENSISNRTAADAELLEKFFIELKKMSMDQRAGSKIKQALILGQELKNVPVLDYTLGGTAFELEILKLFKGYMDEETGKAAVQNLGQKTASVYIDLGSESAEKAIEGMLNKTLEDIPENVQKSIIKNIYSNSEIQSGYPGGYSLKVGAKRMGKIDVKANEGAEISFEIKGSPSPEILKAFDLLKNSSFSIKSYESNEAVHLGETTKKKAVSAISEYVAEKYDPSARWAGIFFYHHPENESSLRGTESDRDKLYAHYGHMHKVYELTGAGLRYDDLKDLYTVDFLLVNRTKKEDIRVYSTQELIQQISTSGKYKSIY